MAAQDKPQGKPIRPVPHLVPAKSVRPHPTKNESIAAKDLHRPEEYGRPLRPHWINQLVAMWDKDKAGTLIVSCRVDGRYYAITGNHRAASRMKASDPDFQFNCFVHYNITLAEEAKIYLSQDNQRLRHTVADDFNAMVLEGDEAAQGVKRVLDSLGMEVAPYGESGFKLARIRAVSALLNSYAINGEERLRTALHLLQAEWTGEADTLTAQKKGIYTLATIPSLTTFLRLYENDPVFDLVWLRLAMKREGLDGWESIWLDHRRAARASPSTSIAVLYGVLAWVDIYNYRKQRRRLDDTIARKWSHQGGTGAGKKRARQKAPGDAPARGASGQSGPEAPGAAAAKAR